MSRLSYFFKRLFKMDWKAMWKTAGLLHERSGKSRIWLLCDMLRCAVKYNAGYVDYKIAQMYKLNDAQRKTVITRGISNSIVRRMNDKAYWHFFDDKTQFNELFKEWIPRKWLLINADTPLDKLEDMMTLPALIGKPLEGSSGQGILKFTPEDWKGGAKAFHQLLMDKNIGILEEIVVQHPEMARMCPTSVNTCRIATLLGDKKQGIVYAFLRIGNGKVMDNVDCGGMAARIDLESGKLLTVGADKAGNTYTKHPITGTDIIGFTIPYWKRRRRCALTPRRKYRKCALSRGTSPSRRTARRSLKATASPAMLYHSLPRITRTVSVSCRNSANSSTCDLLAGGADASPAFLHLFDDFLRSSSLFQQDFSDEKANFYFRYLGGLLRRLDFIRWRDDRGTAAQRWLAILQATARLDAGRCEQCGTSGSRFTP